MAEDTDTQSIALFGAGGKMGCRITDRISDDPAYEIDYVEPSDEGQSRLSDREVTTTAAEEALDGADAVILAVPDELMGSIAEDVVSQVDSGTMVILLDPAGTHAGVLPERDDITYFVTHPCHPPLFDPDREPEHETDWFGGQGMAEQSIVCSLHQGPSEDYARGEAIARDIFAPVREAHRITTREMAILELSLAEALAGSCVEFIREGRDHAVEMGIDEAAATDFLMGHLRIDIAIIFDIVEFPFSDAARRTIDSTRDDLVADDWKEQIFDDERLRDRVEAVATPSND